MVHVDVARAADEEVLEQERAVALDARGQRVDLADLEVVVAQPHLRVSSAAQQRRGEEQRRCDDDAHDRDHEAPAAAALVGARGVVLGRGAGLGAGGGHRPIVPVL